MFPIQEGTWLSGVLGICFPGSGEEEPIKPRKCPHCGSEAEKHTVIEFGEAGWSNTEYQCNGCGKTFSWITY